MNGSVTTHIFEANALPPKVEADVSNAGEDSGVGEVTVVTEMRPFALHRLNDPCPLVDGHRSVHNGRVDAVLRQDLRRHSRERSQRVRGETVLTPLMTSRYMAQLTMITTLTGRTTPKSGVSMGSSATPSDRPLSASSGM